MTQKPRKSDFGELKKKKKIHGVHASDPPRSLRLRRSFWKTVSIYSKSAPATRQVLGKPTPMVFSTGQRLFQRILAILQTTGPKFVPKSSYFSAKSAKFSTFQERLTKKNLKFLKQ